MSDWNNLRWRIFQINYRDSQISNVEYQFCWHNNESTEDSSPLQSNFAMEKDTFCNVYIFRLRHTLSAPLWSHWKQFFALPFKPILLPCHSSRFCCPAIQANFVALPFKPILLPCQLAQFCYPDIKANFVTLPFRPKRPL